METRTSLTRPKVRIDRSEILISRDNRGSVREEIVVMNEGSGRLYGLVRSEAPWVSVLNSTLDTTFIQRIPLEIRCDKAPKKGEAWITIISTGGINRVKVGFKNSPVPAPELFLDEKVFQFCYCYPNEVIPFRIPVKNLGKGFLSGKVLSLSDWIEISSPKIWTQGEQILQAFVHTEKAPSARHPIGRINIRTNGGDETIEVSIHRSSHKGPGILLNPSTLRISWKLRGVIEETVTIRNTGTGILRGTIPAKYPWITAVPSIFSVETSYQCKIRVDTRLLPPSAPSSVTLDLITNAGRIQLNLEIIRAHIPAVRITGRIPGRYRVRSRMTVMDENHKPLALVSSGRSGGEGEIWNVEGDDSVCVKLFHPHRISPDLEEKLKVMKRHPVQTPPHTGLCWPAGIISGPDFDNRFLGYRMKRLDSDTFKPAHFWYDSPDINRSFAIQVARGLASLVNAIHTAGHRIGDFRENNLFINKDGDIYLIDTDSFQISTPDSSQTWFCKVGTGEYLPPELLTGSCDLQTKDRFYSDLFALSVLIFKFLMKGVHPFQARGQQVDDAPATTDKIIKGFFAFEGKIRGLSPPEYAPPYEEVSSAIRGLFHDTFVSGHKRPKVRPDAIRWMLTLGSDKTSGKSHHSISITRLNFRESRVEKAECQEYCDENGIRIDISDLIIRIYNGEIRKVNREKHHILISYGGFKLSRVFNSKRDDLPSSIISPVSAVYTGDNQSKLYGYLIPAFDRSRYVHWHIVTDPESRRLRWGESFNFRHRVAACINLISSLISIHRSGLVPFSLSPRSVFIGPDSSVKILALQGNSSEIIEKNALKDIRILMALMFMDGYHPDKIFGKPVRNKRGSLPSPSIIPLSLRNFITEETGIPGNSYHDTLVNLHIRGKLALWSLKRCTINPDHWYPVYPGYCPWCRPSGHDILLLSTQKPVYLSIVQTPLRLSEPSINSLSVYYRNMRPIALTGEVKCSIIYLTENLNSLKRLISRHFPKLHPYTSEEHGFLQIRNCTSLMVQKSRCNALKRHYLNVQTNKANLRSNDFFQEISLIDEMRWYDSFDRMKGEYQLSGNKNRRRQRPNYVRRTVEIMIFPGNFGETNRKMNKKRKISKKFTDLINDIFG